METSLGGLAMRALIQAYAAAAGRNGPAVTTLDVAAWIAAQDRALMRGASWNNVRNFAIAPSHVPDAAEPSSGPFHPEVPAILRDVEWRARRLPWAHGRPGWTPAVRVVITVALESAGVPFAGPAHLMRAMLEMPHCSGTSFLFPYENGQADGLRRFFCSPALSRSDDPHPAVDHVRLMLALGRRPLLDKLIHKTATGTGHLLLALLESEAAVFVPDTATLRERVTEDLRTVPAAWS
ncbi:hypothetical protein M1L60_29415 [Actinoplanes sp. TRM 88003]|uniref:Uncharacterized protein n=1 Tax=Paractinoplanes aksuensis TaxID=2939490 RepID=A0ABT1DVX9_9ACTN|nr:hypothetical protein [Actinoplanes aksuensis]MCO8274723.1 hypothetical protein [Actinoplanes aksuensis]